MIRYAVTIWELLAYYSKYEDQFRYVDRVHI